MSHIVTISTEVRDPAAVAAACRRLGLPAPGTAPPRSSAARPPGCSSGCPAGPTRSSPTPTAAGSSSTTSAAPGATAATSTAFLQRYAVEKATLEARRRGHAVAEQSLPDGSIRLTIHVGGAA